LHTPSGTEPVINESPDLALKNNEHLDDHNEEAGTAQDAEALKKAEAARRNSDEVEGANRKKNPEDAADNVEGKKGEGYESDRDDKGVKTKDDNKNSTPEKSDNWRGGTDGAGTGGSSGGAGGAGGERKDLEGKEPRTSRARVQGEAKPAEAAPPPKAPSPENRPAENGPAKEAAKAKDSREEITIDVSGTRAADSPSLTTDMLQVASVYGEATASSDETGATIEVEVNEDQLAEMVAALNKLAKEAKETERTRREAEDPQTDDQSKEEPARARDYLPKEKREAAKEAPQSDAETEKAEKPKTAAPAQGKKKVRIIVRLK